MMSKWLGYAGISVFSGVSIAVTLLVLRWLVMVCIRAFRGVPRPYPATPSAGAGRNPFADSGNDPAEPREPTRE